MVNKDININDKQSTVRVSIVMPAYNEDRIIFDNLIETIDIISRFHDYFELVVVDDGSKDHTYAEMMRASKIDERIKSFRTKENMGKGHALAIGTKQAKGELIIFLDSDLDLSPSHVESFIKMMESEKAEVVIGSKLHPDSEVEYPLQRQIISFCYYLIIRLLFSLKVHDTQTGIKLFKASIIKPVMESILIKRFAFDIEVLALCQRLGMKIVEHRVKLVFRRENPYGRMKMIDLFHTGWDTLAIFYRLNIKRSYKIISKKSNEKRKNEGEFDVS